MMGWTAAKTGNQLVIGFAMLKTIMNIVTLIEEIAVLMSMLVMVFVMTLTIILYVVLMIKVIAVWMSQLQFTALIANAMKIACPSINVELGHKQSKSSKRQFVLLFAKLQCPSLVKF